jgi:hypothetical protein
MRGNQPNIGALLPLLNASTKSREQKQAVIAIRDISERLGARRKIVEAGVVPLLVQLLAPAHGVGVESARRDCQEFAAEVLANLSASQGLEQSLVDGGVLPPMVALLSSNQGSCKVYAAFTIANVIATEDDSLARTAVHMGALQPMVLLLSATDVRLQRYSSSAIFNLSAAEGFGELLLDHGVIEPLLPMLKANADAECRENANATIGNLASSPELRQRIVDAGHMAALASLLSGSGLD